MNRLVHSRNASRNAFASRRRSLGKNVSPSRWGPAINIAEPKLVIEWFAALAALFPEFGSDDRCIAPHSHSLLRILLVFIRPERVPRFVQQVALGIHVP